MPNKALVVEDDSVTAKVLEAALKNAGYEVTIVHTAEEAMESIESRLKLSEEGKERWFSLICLDIHLPQSDGISMLFSLRQLEEQYGKVGSECSNVIVVTGDETMHTFHEASVLNVLGYLIKPIDTEKLKELLPRQG